MSVCQMYRMSNVHLPTVLEPDFRFYLKDILRSLTFCILIAVTLGCGSTARDNCTYLVQSAFTTGLQVPCTYSICKAGSNICRIRYDFTVCIY